MMGDTGKTEQPPKAPFYLEEIQNEKKLTEYIYNLKIKNNNKNSFAHIKHIKNPVVFPRLN